jgi:hypothetical protein
MLIFYYYFFKLQFNITSLAIRQTVSKSTFICEKLKDLAKYVRQAQQSTVLNTQQTQNSWPDSWPSHGYSWQTVGSNAKT